jgi:(S)-2-hydroxyglutarate dehydrogenase
MSSMDREGSKADIAVIGGGIVGLATAYQLTSRHPRRSVVVLEKEPAVALHQTGHNSGVLHTGVYYRPGSLKAKNCRDGKRAMEDFCRAEGLPFEICGKLIVAVGEDELARLDAIRERGEKNGVKSELIGVDRLREIEPHSAGIRALHVPEAGIVDFRAVAERLAERVREAGGQVRCNARVFALSRRSGGVVLETDAGEIQARWVVNAAGLHCDRIARLGGAQPAVKIVPFRGEYYRLAHGAERLCRNLIYPVPDPSFPFLGVHFTRMIGGGVECGPNAVLAFAREGYSLGRVNARDLVESLTYRGSLRLMARHFRVGAGEMWRSLSKRAFVASLQRLVPEIRARDLERAPAGVRAQAVSPDGSLLDDFLIQRDGPLVHVLNAPSPAATAALNVGRLIVEHLAADLGA